MVSKANVPGICAHLTDESSFGPRIAAGAARMEVFERQIGSAPDLHRMGRHPHSPLAPKLARIAQLAPTPHGGRRSEPGTIRRRRRLRSWLASRRAARSSRVRRVILAPHTRHIYAHPVRMASGFGDAVAVRLEVPAIKASRGLAPPSHFTARFRSPVIQRQIMALRAMPGAP